ncbi:hypothetical protein [Kribbella sp. C-35]|uniref:hypothetical protein n=1 Tax=Kribbella sp. C-35 TaxID=2789276 RepID=UPI0039782B39
MIHVPIILGIKIASAIYRNRETISAGLQSLREQPPTAEPSAASGESSAPAPNEALDRTATST